MCKDQNLQFPKALKVIKSAFSEFLNPISLYFVLFFHLWIFFFSDFMWNVTMLEKSLVVSIFIVFCSTKVASKSVIGTIRENTTWFLSNLSVRPAMTASLEYHVQYPYVEGRSRPIITFYYNGQKSPNLISHCETDMYGQLRSEDLAVPLNEPYRGKFFCYENETNKIYHCRGITKIQDFEPKSYSFSFCNEC